MKIKKYRVILEFHNISKRMKIYQCKINKQTKNVYFIVENYRMQHKTQILL